MNVSRNKLLLNMAQKGVQKEINEISDLTNLKKTMQNSNENSDTENELIQLSDLQTEMYSSLDLNSFDKSSLPLLGIDTLEQILNDDDEQHTELSITTSAETHINNTNACPAYSIVCPQKRSITPTLPEYSASSITTSADIHNNPRANPANVIVYTQTRSYTPTPTEYSTLSITTSADIHYNPTASPADLTGCSPSRSITPMPLEYISFETEAQLPHVIAEDDVLHTLNAQITSPSILVTDTSATSSASGASSECSSPSSTVMSGRKRRKFTVDVTKKKRKCRKENWIDTRRKLLLNLGKKHLSRDGKEQKQKDVRLPCVSCKFKCCTKICEEKRQKIFDLFWGLGNHVKQWEFIGKYTKRQTKKRITTDNESKRNMSVQYFLPILSENNKDRAVKVCKVMFKNTLCISNQFIQSAMDKYDKTTGFCEKDRRGAHGKQTKLLTETVIQSVCDHVKSYQPVESHYTRKDTNKLYLDNSLNFSIMFKMYKTWAHENNLTETVKTLRQYRDVVNSHMNIDFFVPKKDQCDQCTANKNMPPNESQDQMYAKHIQNKNVARSLKTEDKQQSRNSPSDIGAATFDFQKILNCPHGEVNSFYYKRKLSVYNFTVFDMGLKQAICYMWDETIARRGSNEVASCLFDYIKRKNREGVKDIRLWSDNCGGQNRNRIVFAMYLHVAKNFGVRICHRFLEKGTQQEGDSVHALIERSSKNKMIFTPDEWYTCVRWSKTNDKPYEVVDIKQNDILDFKSTLNQHKWVKNEDGDKVKWNQVREIVVEFRQPDKIFYKYDLNETSAMCINNSKRTSRRVLQVSNNTQDLDKVYRETLPITTAKYKDLMSLCQQNLIPPRYHDFYKNIKHNSAIDESEVVDGVEFEE